MKGDDVKRKRDVFFFSGLVSHFDFFVSFASGAKLGVSGWHVRVVRVSVSEQFLVLYW